MRDYLLALDVEMPPLDGYTHTVLTELLETDRLVDKLLGMQLIVESVAVTLFRSVAQAGVEPVLSRAHALLRARRSAPRRASASSTCRSCSPSSARSKRRASR